MGFVDERVLAVLKDSWVWNGRVRPKYACYIRPRTWRQVSAALSDPSTTIVTLQFSCIRHLCRFEEGGYCARYKPETGLTQEIAFKSQELKDKSHFGARPRTFQ